MRSRSLMIAVVLTTTFGTPRSALGDAATERTADPLLSPLSITSEVSKLSGAACSEEVCRQLELTPNSNNLSCDKVHLFCDDGLLPPGALACCNLNGPLIIFSQSMCFSLGLKSGAYCSDDFDRRIEKEVICDKLDQSCIDRIQSSCTAQHERRHDKDIRTGTPTPSSCALEKDAFKTERLCIERYFEKYCSSGQSSEECRQLSISLCSADAGIAVNECICDQQQIPNEAPDSQWRDWMEGCRSNCGQTPAPPSCKSFDTEKPLEDYAEDYCKQQQPPDEEERLCIADTRKKTNTCAENLSPTCYTDCIKNLMICVESLDLKRDIINRKLCDIWSSPP